MIVICSDCGQVFEDETLLLEASIDNPEATAADLQQTALCEDCAASTVVRLSSTSYLNTNSRD